MKNLGTALAYAVYILIFLLVIRWLKNNISQRARDGYANARQWAQDKRAEMAANRPPDPPPSSLAAHAGAALGGTFEALRLGWRAGKPGFQLGWPRGRNAVYDWWQRRHDRSADSQPRHAAGDPSTTAGPEPTGEGEPQDLTFCPLCGYDLARNRWPLGHRNPTTGQPCGYDYRRDPNWLPCPHCGSPYPPGTDGCLVCGRRVATGPTRFDAVEDEPEPTPTNEPESPAEIPEGTPVTMPTIDKIVEINTIDDLRKAALVQRAAAQVELDDSAAAVQRAKELLDQANTVAQRAGSILDQDPKAAAANAATVEPAQRAYNAAVAKRAAAQQTLDATAAALASLAAHTNVQGAVRDSGGKASTNTQVYA